MSMSTNQVPSIGIREFPISAGDPPQHKQQAAVIISCILLERERQRTSTLNATAIGFSIGGCWFSGCTCIVFRQYDRVTLNVTKIQLQWIRKGEVGLYREVITVG